MIRTPLRFAALSALVALAAGCSIPRSGNPSTGLNLFPDRITVCETNHRTVCGTWTRTSGRTYSAEWADGTRATITGVRFGGRGIEFRRVDDGGVSSGMTAVYTGVLGGRVEWTQNRRTGSGT